MNIPALKGWLEESIKFEYMKLETLKNNINSKTETFIIDYEELFRTQGKIHAFNEILHILNKSDIEKHAKHDIENYAKHDIETISQLYSDKKEGDS